MDDIVVVGAGQCGLRAARMLAEAGPRVTLVERLPAAGGQEPEHEVTDVLCAEAAAAGVTTLLGTLAVSYDGASMQTLGVKGAIQLPSRALVIATGTRPATRGEMQIAGDRGAGVIPGSAAVHLTESGVLLGRYPVVVGGGQLALRCARLLRDAGAREVTLVARDGVVDTQLERARIVSGWRVESIHGVPRVSSVVLERDGYRERLYTDAVVLAHGRTPMRNVEGAVFPAPGVVYCHSQADPKRVDDAQATAEIATRTALKLLEEREATPSSQ